ncbi:MAG: alkaline phosphatase family protein [Planctomycetes bacterium]|nr:alkaline phosphatase family protein [Planctomycetota bacterium]
MKKVLLLDCVGLVPDMIGADTPRLAALARGGHLQALEGVFPAVTCTAQSAMLTGRHAREHGIVGNGWYFRDLAEVGFWKQSNHLVLGDKLWHEARRRDPRFTVCNMFWWYNMYADVDWSLTPRPLYFADGRKLPGIYGRPLDFRRHFEREFEPFPLFNFWGPAADIRSSRWIVQATIEALRRVDATLTLCYVPHLDYDLQRHGPDGVEARRALRELDDCVAPLIDAALDSAREVVVVSEYGIGAVRGDVAINRALRAAGFLETVPQLDRENLDPGASRAFAVADHQVAHVYVADPKDLPALRRLLEGLEGVDRVLDREAQAALGLDHPRSGELVAVAAPDRWFSYYFWDDDRRAPDYARTVDIHRKPGYDPVELFLDPDLVLPAARIAWKVLRKKLGFRMLMDLIPFRPDLVKGSHGRLEASPGQGPILIGSSAPRTAPGSLRDLRALVLDLIFGG